MYLGNERRNRFVALGVAAVLLAGVVLALLATVAAAAPAVGGVAPADRPAVSRALGTVGAASSTVPPVGHHDSVDSVDSVQLTSAGADHPERLVGCSSRSPSC